MFAKFSVCFLNIFYSYRRFSQVYCFTVYYCCPVTNLFITHSYVLSTVHTNKNKATSYLWMNQRKLAYCQPENKHQCHLICYIVSTVTLEVFFGSCNFYFAFFAKKKLFPSCSSFHYFVGAFMLGLYSGEGYFIIHSVFAVRQTITI